MDKPKPPPEAALIDRTRKTRVPKIAQREAAKRAGISESRWRQIVAGAQPMGGGNWAPVRAPAETLARMARAVGVTAEQLDSVGRTDAAQLLVPDVVTQDLQGGWITVGDEVNAEDPGMLAFAEEVLKEALQIVQAKRRHQNEEGDPK